MQLIDVPSLITAAGAPSKLIAEDVGRLNTGGYSIDHMISSRRMAGARAKGRNSASTRWCWACRDMGRAPLTRKSLASLSGSNAPNC